MSYRLGKIHTDSKGGAHIVPTHPESKDAKKAKEAKEKAEKPTEPKKDAPP